ncbi:MAG: ATP-binding protein [Bacteroidales bacterium]|nr:ATP-binding protein [Bacteroidales bacterium]
MKDLSLHLLDIAQNSMVVGSTHVRIAVEVDSQLDAVRLEVGDDGRGMDEEFLRRVADPFTTTRTTRKVGLGIPLLKQNAERTGGYLRIESAPGRGTRVEAVLRPSSIDCLPLGDIGGAAAMMICSNPHVNVEFSYVRDGRSFEVSTHDLEEALEGIPLNDASVYAPITELMRSGIAEADGLSQ